MKAKKLNLNDMWKLYLLLKPAMDNRKPEPVFLDEAEKLLILSKPRTLFECLDILYDNNDIHKIEPGKEYIILFMEGLLQNSFYRFVDFIKVISK